LCRVNIEVPLLVLKLSGKVKPRYLVTQYEVRGVMNTPTLVYADTFFRRSDTEKAVRAANDPVTLCCQARPRTYRAAAPKAPCSRLAA
jgi:hypothetical protein